LVGHRSVAARRECRLTPRSTPDPLRQAS
jgi:hypothetical protein